MSGAGRPVSGGAGLLRLRAMRAGDGFAEAVGLLQMRVVTRHSLAALAQLVLYRGVTLVLRRIAGVMGNAKDGGPPRFAAMP